MVTRPVYSFAIGMVCGAFLAAGTLFIATTTDVRPTGAQLLPVLISLDWLHGGRPRRHRHVVFVTGS